MAGLEHQKSFNKIDANNLSSLFNEFLENQGKDNKKHKGDRGKKAPL